MEMVVIALAIIVLFGPDKLPSIARDLGSGVRKMKGAMEDIKSEILKEADNPVSEIKREIEKVKEAAREYNPLEDIKKEVDELKDSATISSSDSKNTSEPVAKINLSEDDSYQGPVSR